MKNMLQITHIVGTEPHLQYVRHYLLEETLFSIVVGATEILLSTLAGTPAVEEFARLCTEHRRNYQVVSDAPDVALHIAVNSAKLASDAYKLPLRFVQQGGESTEASMEQELKQAIARLYAANTRIMRAPVVLTGEDADDDDSIG
jgi:hypothetical protein